MFVLLGLAPFPWHSVLKVHRVVTCIRMPFLFRLTRGTGGVYHLQTLEPSVHTRSQRTSSLALGGPGGPRGDEASRDEAIYLWWPTEL